MRTAGHQVGVPAQPLLPGFFRVIPMGPDCLQLRSAGRVVRFTAEGIGSYGPGLLSALDGRSTPAELARRFQLDTAVVDRVLCRLHRDGLVADAAGGEGAAGGDPECNPAAAEVFAELGREPRKVAAALRRSKVAVAGLGPVARLAAQHLASSGVGRLVLADDRAVSAFDHACAPSASSAVGRPRTEVASEECAVAARATTVDREPVSIAASLPAAMEGCDLVVVEVEEAGTGAEAANAACLAAGTTALFHEVGTFEAVVGPATGPRDGPCWACARQRRRGHLRYHDEQLAYEQAVRDGTVPHRHAALLGGYAALVGGLVSTEALSVLAGFRDPSTRNGVLVADLRTLAVRREEVLAIPDCLSCWRGEEEVVLLG